MSYGLDEIVKLEGSIDLKKMDKALSELSYEIKYQNIFLDLSQAIWLDVRCLMYIISYLYSRKKFREKFVIALPKGNSDVNDFVLAWNFPEAINIAIGSNNVQIIGNIDNNNRTNTAKSNKYVTGKRIDQYGEIQQIINKYLPIIVFKKSDSNFTGSLALEEADRWKGLVIKSYLERILIGPSSYFASRIVFEAMMNAIRHPNADIIMTASRLSYSKGEQSKLLMYWLDNGASIIDTLKAPLLKDDNLKIISNYKDIVKYNLVYREISLQKEVVKYTEVIKSNIVIDLDSNNEVILLAALFPGTSCDIKGKTHITHPDLGKEDGQENDSRLSELLKRPGMGLHLLVNAVVHIYKGELAIRTDEYNVNVLHPNDIGSYDYDVVITKYLNKNKFIGNILSAKIPVNC